MRNKNQWMRWLCCFLAAFVLGTTVPVGIGAETSVQTAQAASTPKLAKTKLSLKVGKTYTLKLKNATASKITWKSNNKKVAKISSKGKVTAVKAGTTKVYAVYKSKKYYCSVTVKKATTTTTTTTSTTTKEPDVNTVSGRETIAKNTAAEIIKAEGMAELTTDVAKVKAAHDYLVLNAEYNEVALENDTLTSIDHEAYGILVKKTGVCDGYAYAFQIFMDLLNVKCEVVIGYAGTTGHAWNAVTLDGERYHVDVTYDDPVPDQKGEVSYSYFLVNDATLRKDHTWNIWPYSTAACTGTKYRTYPYEQMGVVKVDTIAELEKAVKEQYESGDKTSPKIQIFVNKSISEATVDDTVGWYIYSQTGKTSWYYDSITSGIDGNYYYYKFNYAV